MFILGLIGFLGLMPLTALQAEEAVETPADGVESLPGEADAIAVIDGFHEHGPNGYITIYSNPRIIHRLNINNNIHA